MIRVPSLPLNTYSFLSSLNYDNARSAIEGNKEICNFLNVSLPVSSSSLYNSFTNPSDSEKKQHNLNISLIKYLNRACTRPTPFGLMAGTALGNFSDNTNLVLQSESSQDEITVDAQWINNVIYTLEKNPKLIKQLKVKFNPNCYVWGDRLKNPYFSNHGILKGKDECINDSDIKYTKLTELISSAKSFVDFSKLYRQIQVQCIDVPNHLIEATLQSLIENEYLLTELRIPAYCADPLQHVISILRGKKDVEDICSRLENIHEKFRAYNFTENKAEYLRQLFLEMRGVYNSDNLICVNRGLQFVTQNLDRHLCQKIENFVNCMAHISVDRKEYTLLNVFREAFLEKYGLNVEVPLLEVLDPNGFDGLSKIEPFNIDVSEREAAIKRVFDTNILDALINNKKEVVLHQSDFANVPAPNTYAKSPISLDLDFVIQKNSNGAYHIQLAPNAGSEKAGQMFQRFSSVLNQDLMSQYNEIYQIEKDLIDDEYILVDAREYPAAGRVLNIMNHTNHHTYYLTMGCTTQKQSDNEISIHDLCIGVTEGRLLYLKCISKNKKCKIILDNMVSERVNNRILRLLRYISDEYENSILKRCFNLYQNRYTYVPRIVLEDVIIHPRSWNFTDVDLDISEYESFKQSFNIKIRQYHIDEHFYLCHGDRKLLLSYARENDIRILYYHAKKHKEIYLTEVEPNFSAGALIVDENGKLYNSEFVFSLFLDSNTRKEELTKLQHLENDVKNNRLRCNQDSRFVLGDDSWVYFKLYGLGSKENQVLTKSLPCLLNDLKVEKFFFLRYSEQGKHLRIRFKFFNEKDMYDGLKTINIWVNDLSKHGLVNRLVFDTYERETNRYGGSNLISIAERVFFADSLFVLGILSYFDTSNAADLDIIYTVGICSAFLALTDSLDDTFLLLDEEGLKTGFKHEFQKQRKLFLHIVRCVAEHRILDVDHRFNKIVQQYNTRTDIMHEYGNCLKKELELGNVPKKKSDVLYSIVHMYCNRILGHTKQEAKYLSITRHAIYAYLKEKEYLKKQ